MSGETLDTKNRILQIAIELVGLKGDFTIREITEKSGVNVASINYYFGNKSSLLKEVENYYSEQLYHIQHGIFNNSALTAVEKLASWAKSLIEFMFKSPALISLIVNIVNEDKSYKPQFVEKIYLNKELQQTIESLIKDNTGISDEKLLNYKYLQIFSGVLGPVISRIVSQTFGEGPSIFDFSSPEDIDRYINNLIDGVLYS